MLKETIIQLSLNGYVVYDLTDPTGNYVSDIEKIVKQNVNSVLVIDTYGNYRELVTYLLSINLQKVKIILSERTANHHGYFSEFDGKLKTKDINIDILSDQEIDQIIKILEHTSLWGKYGSYSYSRKKRHIAYSCEKQLSNILIDILKNTHIKKEVGKLLVNIFKDENLKLNLLIICLLDTMNIPTSLSLISDLSDNDSIFSKFLNTNEICHFFTLNRFHRSINTRSSIYSLYLLNEHFGPSYIIDKCVYLLVHLEGKFNQNSLDRLRNHIRINLFRFNFIERILPMKHKTSMLVNYYEKIKNDLPNHIKNPQYWLQYAMAHIALSNYDEAYRYLQAAYDKSKSKHHYDTHKIDNQKARLNLIVASQNSTAIEESMNLFFEADKLLNKQENDVFKFKVVNKYFEFYDSKKILFNETHRSRMKKICELKLNELASLKDSNYSNYKQERVYQNCENNLNTIIAAIKN